MSNHGCSLVRMVGYLVIALGVFGFSLLQFPSFASGDTPQLIGRLSILLGISLTVSIPLFIVFTLIFITVKGIFLGIFYFPWKMAQLRRKAEMTVGRGAGSEIEI